MTPGEFDYGRACLRNELRPLARDDPEPRMRPGAYSPCYVAGVTLHRPRVVLLASGSGLKPSLWVESFLIHGDRLR